MSKYYHEIDYVMVYPPSPRALKEDYPELNSIVEFKKCNSNELKFAWYYSVFYGEEDLASKDSNEKIRIKNSINNSFQRGNKMSYLQGKEYDSYMEGDFPEHVREAIAKFKTYNPDVRYIARWTAERALYNLQRFVEFDEEEVVDWEVRKKYVDTVTTIMKELPALISQVETGFGLRKVKYSKSQYLTPDIDKWHEQNK